MSYFSFCFISLFLSNSGYYESEKKVITFVKIIGSVVDGPIYDAKLFIYDMDNNLLGEATTSSKDGKIGDYSLSINNLPEQYIVKVVGGKDTGPDGEINDNDEESFEMSSVGSKSNPITFISPATTLIANLVAEGKTVDDAKKAISKALGISEDIDLTTTNPKTDDIANQAGNFVAQVMKAIPSSDRIQSLKSIAKQFCESVEDNKTIAILNGVDIQIKSLNLSEIADDIQSNKPESITQSKIAKLQKTQSLLNDKIAFTITAMKPVSSQTVEEKKEAMTSYQALQGLSSEIEDSEIEDVDVDFLRVFSNKLEDGYKNILMKDTQESISIENIKENTEKQILDDAAAKKLAEEQAAAEKLKEPLPIKKTGQTTSYLADDDGDYQTGISPHYTRDDSTEIVEDYITNLMWQDNIKVRTVKKEWQYAETYCSNLILGGYDDWYLPSRKELVSIVDYGSYDPSLGSIFKNFTSRYYWSSTKNARYSSSIWGVYFYDGRSHGYDKAGALYVRCVRAGQ